MYRPATVLEYSHGRARGIAENKYEPRRSGWRDWSDWELRSHTIVAEADPIQYALPTQLEGKAQRD